MASTWREKTFQNKIEVGGEKSALRRQKRVTEDALGGMCPG